MSPAPPQICSNLCNLDLTVHGLPDMFKLVYYDGRTVRKEAVDIRLKCLLVTARKRSLGQGNIFTLVCHSVHWGGLPQCMLGYHPPDQAHPLRPGTPPRPGTPLDQAPPPAQSMLGDTVNARAVRILQEYILFQVLLLR